MKLRYTGPNTITFLTAGVGEVEPGAEFTVPDDSAEVFTRRADIEEVPDLPDEKPVVSKKKPVVDNPVEIAPEPTEAAPAVDTENS